MNGLILTIQADGTGFQATIWEGCFTIYQATGFASVMLALLAGQAWLTDHRRGAACLIEVPPAPQVARS